MQKAKVFLALLALLLPTLIGAQTLQLTKVATMSEVRQSVGIVTHNGYLYLIGGWNSADGVFTSVYYAKINADGSLGTLQTTTADLPESRMYYNGDGCCAYGNYVYVVGGTGPGSGDWQTSTIYYAAPETNGDITSWNTGATYDGIDYHAAVAYNDYLYIVGGERWMTDHDEFDWVAYAPINTGDGSIGSWTFSDTLPMNSFGSKADVSEDGYLFLWGGRTDYNTPFTYNDACWSAQLQSDGSIGTWLAQDSMPQGVTAAAGRIMPPDNHIFSVAGRAGVAPDDYVDFLYRNQVAAGGTLTMSTWDSSVVYPEEVRYIGMACHQEGAQGFFYIAGGQGSGGALSDSVYMGTIPVPTPTPTQASAHSGWALYE